MRATEILMGMPITLDIAGTGAALLLDQVFDHFETVDRRFSTYRHDSEIAAINRGELAVADCSAQMREVLAIAETTRRETDGYFDIRRPDGRLDPSGVVKGWAIRAAAEMIRHAGVRDFYVDAGGDIQASGHNAVGGPWSVGVRNPFDADGIIKVLYPGDRGVATSGSYVRGLHIYNPHQPWAGCGALVSLTVIGPDVLEADRFATAAFAMGLAGIGFIDSHPELEGYAVTRAGRAIPSGGFSNFCAP